MSKRKPSGSAPIKRGAKSFAPLAKAMSKCSKAVLLDALLELAKEDRGILRQLTARFGVPQAPRELAASTTQAIIDATAFDVTEMNSNFDFDYAAYDEVKRNLGRLIRAGQLKLAMQLSLELMKRGSHQVEMSDEGLMTQDIEDCLDVVLGSLRKCDLPAHELIAWCSAMLKADRVKFIATDQLKSLQSHLQKSAD